MTAVRLVLTTCPNAEVAQAIARALVGERLAACVNVLAPCRSFYTWQGQACEDDEVPLVIKTSAERYAAVEARVRELHPYQLPELVALPVVDGLPAYLAWVAGQTAA